MALLASAVEVCHRWSEPAVTADQVDQVDQAVVASYGVQVGCYVPEGGPP